MIQINGKRGGGQLLRTALSLSALYGEAFQMRNIRRFRPFPGLKRQHVTATETVARLCNAEFEGAAVGSQSLTFRPGSLNSENIAVEMPTAGSVTMIVETVLPITLAFENPFELTVTGGTDVKWAPTVDYHRWVKLHLLSRFGLDARINVHRTGFYPAGDGRITLRTHPAAPTPIKLRRRGDLRTVEIYSKASNELAARNVAQRQAHEAARRLENLTLPAQIATVDYVETASPGSAVFLRGVYDETLTGFDALGERGKPSETVAEEAVTRFQAIHERDGVVDEKMADQLQVFLALISGIVTIPWVTDHVETNLDVIAAFGGAIRLTRQANGAAILERSKTNRRRI
ncbi:RNA 3'-terminal phosphate cyclase [Haladaptatus halobius]|uniref:RNA 3'-terminal phosphate cyclase n=1 Tax=Haladaptatus halobius TaxID=2884875 RepID=UPI001D0A7903|nr:RNA 3'-terminal phosphate cyclase [Haladaptatus halobius]